VAQKIAEIMDVTEDEVAEITSSNAVKLFNLQ
jgi:Tat protein secretion system quality control protein TatD with DNase activity